MDSADLSQVTDLLAGRKWVPLAALFIAVLLRQLKSDAKLPITLSDRGRYILGMVLGLISGGLEAIKMGTPWKTALVGGLVSGALAVLTKVPMGKPADPPSSGDGGSSKGAGIAGAGLLIFHAAALSLVLILMPACTAAQAQTDAKILDGMASVLGDQNPLSMGLRALAVVLRNAGSKDFDPAPYIAKVEDAVAHQDWSMAYDTAKAGIAAARSAGAKIPPAVDVVIEQTGGLIAANAIEHGMRALSQPSAADAGAK
jgi:hypothetical protein